MLGHLEHPAAIRRRHPVVRLDELAGVDLRFELGELRGVFLESVVNVQAYVGTSTHERFTTADTESTENTAILSKNALYERTSFLSLLPLTYSFGCCALGDLSSMRRSS